MRRTRSSTRRSDHPPAPEWPFPGSCISRWCRARCTTRRTRSTADTSPTWKVCPLRSPTDSVDAAVATAAHDVLVGLTHPPHRRSAAAPGHARLAPCAALVASLAEIPDGASKDGGIEIGEPPRTRCWGSGRTTVASCRFTFTAATDAGEWRPGHQGSSTTRSHGSPTSARSRSRAPRSSGLTGRTPWRASNTRPIRRGRVARTGCRARAALPSRRPSAPFSVENPVLMLEPDFRTIAADRGLTVTDAARLFGRLI